MSIDCPDNSTECLLRALIETTANQSSPWEPRSFGFTVAIGVAAFLISFVAIFQGLLAAGPGRIKASSEAIGAFSKLSKGHLSWVEFAWRSTAWTPTIIFNELVPNLVAQRQLTADEHGTCYPFMSQKFNTGATWSRLLQYVGLDDDILNIFETCLDACSTDHLPTDIQAPPASIQLSCLAVFAGIVDGTTTFRYSEGADRRLLIQGKYSQVNYREHPVLGSLAAYERYQTRVPSLFKPNRNRPIAEFSSWGRCTLRALYTAQGYLEMTWYAMQPWFSKVHPTAKTFLLCPKVSTGQIFHVHHWPANEEEVLTCKHSTQSSWAGALVLMVARTEYELRPFPWASSGLAEAVLWIKQSSPELFKSEEELKKYLSKILPVLSSSDDDWKQRSREDDILFEDAGSWLVPIRPEAPLLPACLDLSDVKVIFRECKTLLDRVEGRLPRQTETKDTSYEYVNSVTECFCTLKHIDVFLRHKRNEGLRWINKVSDLNVEREEREEEAQKAANSSLNEATPVAAANSAEVLGNSSIDSIPSDSASGNDAQSSGESTSQDSAARDTLTPPSLGVESISLAVQEETEITVERSLQSLLMIRAMMLGALLEAGPDTSILWEPDFKNPMVKMM